MNLAAYSSVSLAAACACIGNGYLTSEGGLYEMLLQLFRSKFSVLILVNSAFNLMFLFGKAIQRFFFGNLREIEIQNLNDRLLTYVVFKIVFVGAVMEPDVRELLVWMSWFSVLGFLKIFTMLCRDRFEYLSTFSPNASPKVHVKMVVLLVAIMYSDLAWLYFCVHAFYNAGASVLLLLNFECFTIFLDSVQTLCKYGIHLLDLSRQQGVWDQRGQYIYYTEFATDSMILAGTLGHYVHILYLHGLSITLLDAVLFMHMRIVFNNLRDKIVAYRNYRKLADNMNNRYADVSEDELREHNDDCAICRDHMDSAKKLPCGHIFHHSCLRSWLEQHHSCPTCRRSLFDDAPSASSSQTATGAANGGNNNAGPAHANQDPTLPFAANRMFGWFPNFSVQFVAGGPQAHHHHHHAGGLRHRGAPQVVPAEMIRAVQDIFPHVPEQVIAQDLAITRSVEMTTENILEGRVIVPSSPPAFASRQTQPNPTPFTQPSAPPQTRPQQPTRTTNNVAAPQAAVPSVSNNNSHVQSSLKEDSPPDSPVSSASTVLPKYSDKFATTSQERKDSLMARKQAMLEAARRQYLAGSQPQPAPKSAPSLTTTAPGPTVQPIANETSTSVSPATTTTTSTQPSAVVPEPPKTVEAVQEPATPAAPPSIEEQRRLRLEAFERRNASGKM